MLAQHVGLLIMLAGLLSGAPAVCGAAPKPSPETASTRGAIQAKYDRINAALAHKDLGPFLGSRAQEFVYLSPDGRKSSRARVRQDFEQGLSVATTVRATSRIVRFVAQGGSASVRVRSRLALTWVNPRLGRDQTLGIEEEAVDTWVLRRGRWLLTQSRAIQRRNTVDGRREPP